MILAMKKRIYLTFPAELVREPIVCRMYDTLGVQFNLRTASVNDEIGIIGMELEAEPEKIEEWVSEAYRETAALLQAAGLRG